MPDLNLPKPTPPTGAAPLNSAGVPPMQPVAGGVPPLKPPTPPSPLSPPPSLPRPPSAAPTAGSPGIPPAVPGPTLNSAPPTGVLPRPPAPMAAPAGAPQPPRPTQPLASPVAAAPTLGTPPPGIASGPPRSSIPPQSLPPSTPPGTAPPGAGGSKPVLAGVKASPFRFLPFLLGGLVILGLIAFAVYYFFLKPQTQSVDVSSNSTTNGQPARTTVPGKQTTITYWGLWEPSEVLASVFTEFEQAHPGVKINYIKQSHKDYRERLQSSIASGGGPDVYRFHATWTPMLKAELAPVPSSTYTTTEYQKTFYPIAVEQLSINGQLVGIPLMYDGLGLYYNKEILRTAGVQPPTTWVELKNLAQQLTVRSGDTVQRSGLAIGNSTNVEHFSDILGLLMFQNGADPSDPTSAEARDALLFYTNFVKNDKVWSDTLPSSTVAFARGEAAMMFAPSWRAHEIKTQSPQLEFGIAPLPKLGDNNTTWASYWAEGVSAQSKNKDVSWELLKFLSSAATMKKMYSAQANVRSFGEIYSRTDLASELASEELVAPYLSDAPQAKAWYLSSFTHDNGLNDLLIKYYEDAITAVLAGRAADEVLQTVDSGTTQLTRQYGVTSSSQTQ